MYSAYINEIQETLKTEVMKNLRFINWKKYVKKESTVFVKPNFTFPYYKKGITTSPLLIEELLKILSDRCNNIILGESNGGNKSFTAEEAFEGHNMYDICDETNTDLVNLSNLESRIVKGEVQGKKVSVELPSFLLDDVDCLISLPVLKVHVMTQVTLSMKNLWGCHPNTMRCLEHKNLGYKLSLITKKLNPKIVLIDGIYALDNHGPMYGKANKLNLLISSNNPVVADSIGSTIMNFNPSFIEHIQLAEKEGLGISDFKKVKLNDDIQKYVHDFNLSKTPIDMLSVLLFRSRLIAKIVMDSPFTPLIYKIGERLRTKEEQELSTELGNYFNF